jgi:hypothetical protein
VSWQASSFSISVNRELLSSVMGGLFSKCDSLTLNVGKVDSCQMPPHFNVALKVCYQLRQPAPYLIITEQIDAIASRREVQAETFNSTALRDGVVGDSHYRAAFAAFAPNGLNPNRTSTVDNSLRAQSSQTNAVYSVWLEPKREDTAMLIVPITEPDGGVDSIVQ